MRLWPKKRTQAEVRSRHNNPISRFIVKSGLGIDGETADKPQQNGNGQRNGQRRDNNYDRERQRELDTARRELRANRERPRPEDGYPDVKLTSDEIEMLKERAANSFDTDSINENDFLMAYERERAKHIRNGRK